MRVTVGVTVGSVGRSKGALIASEFSADARKRASAAADKSIVTLRGV